MLTEERINEIQDQFTWRHRDLGLVTDSRVQELLDFIATLQSHNNQLIDSLKSVATMKINHQNWGISTGIMQAKARHVLQLLQENRP